MMIDPGGRTCRTAGQKNTPSVLPDGEAQGAVPLSCFTRRASIAAHAEGAAPPAPGRTFSIAPRGPLSASGGPSLSVRSGYSFRSSRFSSLLYYQRQGLVSRRFHKRIGEILCSSLSVPHPAESLRKVGSIQIEKRGREPRPRSLPSQAKESSNVTTTFCRCCPS